MKKVTKIFMAVLLAGMFNLVNAQQYEWQKPVQSGEKQIDLFFCKLYAGVYIEIGEGRKFDDGTTVKDHREFLTETEIYEGLMNELARDSYNIKYPGFIVRDLKYNITEESDVGFAALINVKLSLVSTKNLDD